MGPHRVSDRVGQLASHMSRSLFRGQDWTSRCIYLMPGRHLMLLNDGSGLALMYNTKGDVG